MSLRFQRYPSSFLPALTVLAFTASLAACGGGGGGAGTTPPLVERPDPPATHLPGLPLQSAWDSENSPVLYVGRNIHVGADVAPSPEDLHQPVHHDDIAVSHGTLADGIGINELIDYLEHDTTRIFSADEGDIVIDRFEPRPPTIRIAQGATVQMRDETIRAVQLINAALPRDWQLHVSNVPGTPGAEPPTDAYILIQFLPREEWPNGANGNFVGLTSVTNTLERDGLEYQIVARFSRILVDHTRTTGRDRMDTLVHEIIHSLGRDHPDPEMFPDTIMLSNAQSRDNHTLYPLDREALLAVYSRLQHGSSLASLAQDLGPWSDTSTHLLGEFSASSQDVSFGVALRNGLAQPWATGPAPLTDLANNAQISGTASWSGRLLGFTPSAEPVAGAAELTVALDTLAGALEFTELEQWTAGDAPGPAGTGNTWGDGDLGYVIAVRGNTFTRPTDIDFIREDGDDGIVTGAFFGTRHQAMGGTLQRDDLSAAFGGSR